MFRFFIVRSSAAPAMSGPVRPLAGSGMALDVVTARSVDLGLLQVNGVDMSTASSVFPVASIASMAGRPTMAVGRYQMPVASMNGHRSDLGATGQLALLASLRGGDKLL